MGKKICKFKDQFGRLNIQKLVVTQTVKNKQGRKKMTKVIM